MIRRKTNTNVRKIFSFLKKQFPDFFEGLTLKISSPFERTSTQLKFRCTSRNCFDYVDFLCSEDGKEIDENKTSINFNYDTTLSLKRNSPLWYNEWEKKIKKIDKRFSISDFSLLHELGHWLDYLDSPQKFYINYSFSVILMDKANMTRMNRNELQVFYSGTPLEKKANSNAIKIAKTLVKLGYFS